MVSEYRWGNRNDTQRVFRVRRYSPDYASNLYSEITNGDLYLSELVRPGAKLLSQKTGRVYTVVEARDGNLPNQSGDDRLIIRVLEDPEQEGVVDVDNTIHPATNLWVIPGPVTRPDPGSDRVVFGDSPVLDVVRF